MSALAATATHPNRCSRWLRGYEWRAGNLAQPTTRTSTWSTSEGTHQLDWFCTRGLSVRDPAVVPALAEDGSVLSDHELILLTVDTS